MSEALPPAASNEAGARFVDALRLALSFLTLLPVGPGRAVAPESVAESFAYFPLGGFIIGAALAAEDWMLGFAFGPALKSVLVVMTLAAITGAVHLDGLADTFDALGAGRDRERALDILRDSAIGSFGAIAMFFVLALKIAALTALGAPARWGALYFAAGFARWAMVAVSWKLDYLRKQGAGSAMLAAGGSRNFAFASAITIVAAALVPSLRMVGAGAAAMIAAFAMRWFYRRWLGGVTGDLIGATGEIVEVAVLLAMAA